MAIVKFEKIDLENRTATMSVNGELVTRQIADGITNETLDGHLHALAYGLAIEADEKEAKSTSITGTDFVKGDILVE